MAENMSHNDRSNEQKKLLSVVVVGKNDDYGGNFKYRLSTCLNSIARSLGSIGRLSDVEILVTDWGSSVPLSRALQLTAEASNINSFVYVPSSTVHASRPDGGFYFSLAANASIRRSAGTFIMLYDADSLALQPTWKSLLELMDGTLEVPFDIGRVLLFANRYQIPWEIVQREPSLQEWDRYLVLALGSWLPDMLQPGLGIGGAIWLMHRDLWHECRSLNERFLGMAWNDGELTLRVTQKYPWIDLACVGVNIFHMEHWSRNQRKTWPNAVINPITVSAELQVNDQNWGLGSTDLEIQMAVSAAEPDQMDSVSAPCLETSFGQEPADMVAQLKSELVRKHAQVFFEKHRLHPSDWDSVCALSWYSLHHFPRNYIDFGIRQFWGATTVAAACPGVEIYGIDTWRNGEDQMEPQEIHILPSTLAEAGHRGYVRLLTGDPDNGLKLLKNSFVGDFSADLVMFRSGMFPHTAGDRLDEILYSLANRGMVVVTAESKDQFFALWEFTKQRFDQLTFLQCSAGETGFILGKSFRPSNQPLRSETGNCRNVDCGVPLSPRTQEEARRQGGSFLGLNYIKKALSIYRSSGLSGLSEAFRRKLHKDVAD